MRCVQCQFHSRTTPCAVCASGVSVTRLDGVYPSLVGLQTRQLAVTNAMHRQPQTHAGGRPAVWTHDSILAALQQWAVAHGGKMPSTKACDALTEPTLPHSTTIRKYLGSHGAALQAARRGGKG